MLVMAGLLLTSFLCRPALAQATTGEALAKKMQCLACHQVDKRRVGPAFTVVAERFVEREGGEDYLAYAVRHGGRGSWGAIPMPEQPHVNEENAKLLAQWILSLAPAKSVDAPE